MEIHPIRNEQDHAAALAKIDQLWDAAPGTPEGDQLEILVTLVEAYEARNHPILPPDPIEAILHHMESQGLSRHELEPYIGSRGRVSEVLNRKRPLSLTMIRNLQRGLGISAELLIRPYDLQTS